mmetsp:Transcript_26758/g.64883  ORF Transcript_26758/g.64883 Transcript_26758/m.64883 type:complete len:208 (-) Transcript_26758:541-1164(-)
MTGLFLMFRARFAYLSVLRVSSKFVSDGLTQAIMSVWLFPPSESCSSLVILASRNGTWDPLRFSSPRALMTFPRARSPLLMLIPSRMRSPTAPVLLSRSDPARSTKWNLEVIVSSRTSALSSTISTCVVCLRMMLKIACDRDDVAFIAVAPVTRQAVPLSRQSSMSSGPLASASMAPSTEIPPCFVSRICSSVDLVPGFSRSLMLSL